MKKTVSCIQSSHLDLFWMGRMENCMKMGAEILHKAIEDLKRDESKYFVVETVRFLEYYLDVHPENKESVIGLMKENRLEVGACYSDRLENHHSGESLVRNILYGKRVLRELTGLDTQIAAHPDLPGVTEQTPQIYHQAGIKYYTYARGYRNGARFRWPALNGEAIIAYNYPIHYSYYDYKQLFANLENVEKAISSPDILICLSAGDLGDYGMFQRPENEWEKVPDIVEKFNRTQEEYHMEISGIYKALSQMDESNLPEYCGECPSKWGTYGSATNVESFQDDKRLSALLCDAEKLEALCVLNGIKTDDFAMRHPFCLVDKGHIIRNYYDAKIQPKSIAGWIEFAWRLQVTTQDHNYGGYDGVVSAFDRNIYKKAGIQIAENIIAFCLQKLGGWMGGLQGILAVNPVNWSRQGKVFFDGDEKKSYVARDSRGNIYETARENARFYFEPQMEALEAAVYMVDEKPALEAEQAAEEATAWVCVESDFYKAVFDRELGGLTELTDKETGKNLLGNVPAGILTLYADPSNDVHEELYDKTVLETTKGRIFRVEKGTDKLSHWICWYSEIADSKVVVTLRLSRQRKEFSLVPEIYWLGQAQTQLRVTFGLNPEYQELYYGIPYGIQKFDTYMYGAEPTNPSDEISMELFREYREVQGWYAVQNQEGGISIGTNQAAFAFKAANEFEAVLIRDVASCGDFDVMMDNHGHQVFWFTGTSFVGDDVTENNLYYRRALEIQHPVYATEPGAEKERKAQTEMPQPVKLLEVDGGILSVLQRQEEKVVLRSFSVSRKPETLSVSRGEGQIKLDGCDLLGNPLEKGDTLSFGDIKTAMFEITKK